MIQSSQVLCLTKFDVFAGSPTFENEKILRVVIIFGGLGVYPENKLKILYTLWCILDILIQKVDII